MGVLQRFEQRLEGMVEGAFARAFKSDLQPVEIASAIQREMDDRAAIVAQGRTLVPNDFVVELAESDHERLGVYADSLSVEFANLAREHAKEQGYSFVGPVRTRFEGVRDLTMGTFRIRSGVIRGTTLEAGEIRQPASDLPSPRQPSLTGHPRLLVTSGALAGTSLGLTDQQITVGRANDATLVLNDDYASSRHARLFPQDGQWIVEDLGSTNGTYIDRQKVTQPTPVPIGVPIRIGKTVLELRR